MSTPQPLGIFPCKCHCSSRACILPANTLSQPKITTTAESLLIHVTLCSGAAIVLDMDIPNPNPFSSRKQIPIQIHMDATTALKMAKMLGDATRSRLGERAISARWRPLVRVIELWSHWRFAVWSVWCASKSLSVVETLITARPTITCWLENPFCVAVPLSSLY